MKNLKKDPLCFLKKFWTKTEGKPLGKILIFRISGARTPGYATENHTLLAGKPQPKSLLVAEVVVQLESAPNSAIKMPQNPAAPTAWPHYEWKLVKDKGSAIVQRSKGILEYCTYKMRHPGISEGWGREVVHCFHDEIPKQFV